MNTNNPKNPLRSNNPNDPAGRTEPTEGKNDPRNLQGAQNTSRVAGGPGQRSDGQRSDGQRDESAINRHLDAIEESVRQCRTAMGQERRDSSDRSEPTSSSSSSSYRNQDN